MLAEELAQLPASERIRYRLVTAEESDPQGGLISTASPARAQTV